jgi:hypothetical protein
VKQRSALWVVLAAFVVGAGALVVVVGGGSGDGSPPQLPLAAGGGGDGDARAEMAADAPAIALASVYVAGDGLPELGGEAPAYRLVGEVATSDVRALAEALGIDAEAEPTSAGGSWHVDDGEMALDVYGPDGSWSAYRMGDRVAAREPDAAASSGPASGSGSAGGGTSGSSGGAPQDLVGGAVAEGGVGQVCPGSAPGADNVVSICEPPLCPTGATPPPTGCEPICLDQPDVASDAPRCEPAVCPQYAPGGDTPVAAPDDPCAAPACPGDVADDTRCIPPVTTPAEPGPTDPEPGEPSPTTAPPAPPPPPDLPPEDEARTAALDLLAATGADVDGADVTAENLVSMWSVTVEPSLDGRPAPGLAMYVAVGPEGRIESAGGRLTGPDELGSYPLIDTGAAVTRLNEGWGFVTPQRDVTAAEAAEGGAAGVDDSAAGAAGAARAAELAEPGDGATVEAPAGPADGAPVVTIERAPGPGDPDQPVSDLPVPDPGDHDRPVDRPAPAEVEVTDAEIVLVTVPSWDDSGTYLVPGYRFVAADDSRPTVPAVTDDVLEPPPGAEPVPQPRPLTEDPAAGEAAGPGDRVEVRLYHCGFEELRHDDRRWVVEDPPFDGTNAPPEFVGRGTFAVGDGGRGVYTDGSGIAVTFSAVDEDWEPPPCA